MDILNTLKGELDGGGGDAKRLTAALQGAHPKLQDAETALVLRAVSSNLKWNVNVVGEAIRPLVDGADWKRVVEHLEDGDSDGDGMPALSLGSTDALVNLLKTLSLAAQERKVQAADALLSRKWKNLQHQNDIVAAAAVLSADQFDLGSLALPQVIEPTQYAEAPAHIQAMATSLARQPLNYRHFVHLSLDAVCREDASATTAKTFLDTHAKIVPEIFFLGGISMPKPWPMLLDRVIGNFFELFFAGHSSGPLVFYTLKRLDKKFFVSALVDMFERGASMVLRILLIAHESGLLEDLFAVQHPAFVLEFAAQADRQNMYSFELFLNTYAKGGGGSRSAASGGDGGQQNQQQPDMVSALLDFLEVKASVEYTQSQAGGGLPAAGPNLRSVAAALAFLDKVDIPQDKIEQLKSVQIQCLQAYPRLINFGQGHDAAIMAHGDTNSFPPDVEREMKLYYQRMYEQQIEIRDIITMLQRLKESDDPRDQDVFACMVHSLFDEYRFFPEYPLTALATTAVLFGSLVYFRLIEGMPLSIALRFILESLKQPVDSNMFRFGLQALFEFIQRLPEFPQYCAVLLEIPGLKSQQQFYQQIKDIVGSGADAASASGTADPLVQAVTKPTGPQDFKSVKPDVPLDDTPQEDPPESLSDKVLFIVNNLAQSNVVPKSKELAKLLDKKYYSWFAKYLVGQRARMEPNYHGLYTQMIQAMDNRDVENHILHVSFHHIAQILNHQDTATSAEKRNHLKNLGQWLGGFLLARDRPILYKNIAFKRLLVEGYDLGRLPVVIPFVCKTLEKASASSIFLPPNPWTMGIMQVLSELYQHADLKLNLKFEIEVLCNQLKLDINDIEASTVVRVRRPEDDAGDQNAALALEMQKLRLQGGAGGDPSGAAAAAALQAQLGGAAANRALVNNDFGREASVYSSLIDHLALTGSTGFVTHPALNRIFKVAIDKAIRDVLQPVVERSVTIASIATRDLVTKDFALEPDEQKMRVAAQNVVRVLAANIALVTCKDPLRESLGSHLRALMVANGYADHALLLEQIVMAVNDNLDAVCSIVEKAAVEKSFPEIEEALVPAYLLRKRHRETNPGQSFVDPSLGSRFPLQLPDPFRLKAGGLMPQQLAIYENFGHHAAPRPPSVDFGAASGAGGAGAPAAPPAAQTSQVPPMGSAVYPGGAPAQVFGQSPQTQPMSGAATSLFDQTLLQVQGVIEKIESLLTEAKETSLSEMGSDHAVSVLLTQILNTARLSEFRDELILKISQITVSALFTVAETKLGREVFCYLLVNLCQMSAATEREVVLWLIYSDDERKYNVPVIVTLIRARLIAVSDLDVNLSKHVLLKNESAIKFAIGLITETVLGETPSSLRTEWTGSLEAMGELAKEDPPVQDAVELLRKLDAKENSKIKWQAPNESSSSSKDAKDSSKDTTDVSPELKDQMAYVFAEWTRLVHHPCRTQRSLHIFVYQLSQKGILSHSVPLSALIRTSLEVSVDSYTRALEVQRATISEIFMAVDSLAKLIATIIQVSDKMDVSARVEYARNLLFVLSLVFASEHDAENAPETFQSRPYFRLFSSLLSEVSEIDDGSEFYVQLYLVFADVLTSLQPFAFPGFSFSWMTLISHRLLLPKLMDLPDKRGWPALAGLVSALVRFQGFYMEGKDFTESVAVMYKGTLRIFLVILHDYPAFLIENHYTLCNAIPSSFVQLRNLVLSAFPANIQLPDPLTEGLKVDKLPEVKEAPVLAVDPASELQRFGLKKLVDQYIKAPSLAVVKSLVQAFELAKPKHDAGIGFTEVKANYAALNAFVLYMATQALATSKPPKLTTNSGGSSTDKNDGETSVHFDRDSTHLALIAQLMGHADAEMRYFLCSAMANQLRYPNSHTHFYSCVILTLFAHPFADDVKEAIQHIITRVLLERIICNRPHPWGLMITFTELLKNPSYKFWDLPFTRHTPEVVGMFSSLYSHISNGATRTDAPAAN